MIDVDTGQRTQRGVAHGERRQRDDFDQRSHTILRTDAQNSAPKFTATVTAERTNLRESTTLIRRHQQLASWICDLKIDPNLPPRLESLFHFAFCCAWV
jgi:hypothetical protein